MKQNLKPYQANWPHGYVTRDGRDVTILTTSAELEDYSVVALIHTPHNADKIGTYTPDGLFFIGGPMDDKDLLCKPAPRRFVYACVDRANNILGYGPDPLSALAYRPTGARVRDYRAIRFVEEMDDDIEEGDEE